VVVFAPEALFKGAVEQLQHPHDSLRRGKRSAEIFSRVSPHHLWLIARAQGQKRLALDGIELLGAGMTLKSGVDVRFAVSHREEKAAQTTESMIGVFQSMAASDPSVKSMGLSSALKGASVARDGNLVHGALSLSKAEAAQLLAALQGAL